jgi:D-glycero-alpha-D-manno-heptose 1-phosphate guanylyltransferase
MAIRSFTEIGMEAIILAGGFGTRLQSVVKELPKPMALINDRPFLAYMLSYLKRFDVHSIVLSVGYKKESIQAYFHDAFEGIPLCYACEDEPLGTGGAIKQALKHTKDDYVLVLNGDTFFSIDLNAFWRTPCTDVLIAVKQMRESERYGSLEIDLAGKIRAFHEKKWMQKGYINGGIYKIRRNLFASNDQTSFSFETFLNENVQRLNLNAYDEKEAYFIDIGIPEDYFKAQNDFKELF